MAYKRWNKRTKFSKAISAIVIFVFGEYKTYSWRTKKVRDWKLGAFLLYRDMLGTLSGELRGFGEWRKWRHLRNHEKRCTNPNCRKLWKQNYPLWFHHRKPLKAVQRVFFETPIRLLPNIILIPLANTIANRQGNLELLCLRCHYIEHVKLSRNGYANGAENLLKYHLQKHNIPIPRV